MKFYKIGFDVNRREFEGSILNLPSSRETIYDDLSKDLNCEGLDFQDYSEEILMIVDENGFYKRHNPVFQIKTSFDDFIELAGYIIFARNVETEHSMDIGSIMDSDIIRLRNNLEIRLIGLTNGMK